MKRKNLRKKLLLNKATIMTLDSGEMSVFGGFVHSDRPDLSCTINTETAVAEVCYPPTYSQNCFMVPAGAPC